MRPIPDIEDVLLSSIKLPFFFLRYELNVSWNNHYHDFKLQKMNLNLLNQS